MRPEELEAARKSLESIRHDLTVYCEKCKGNVEPPEEPIPAVVLGVFWRKLDIEKAKGLMLGAHERHAHTEYDKRRVELEIDGLSAKDARDVARTEIRERKD